MLKKVLNKLENMPVWIIVNIISIAAVIFFLFLPFQIDLFPEQDVRKLYFVDHMSAAHYKIINKFNELNKGKINVIPVDLQFENFTTNDRKAILTRSLRNRSDGLDIFAVDIIWVPRFAKWAEPLDNAFSTTIINNVNETALKACYDNNRLVAFPLFLDMGVLYYRQDLIHGLPNGKEIEKKIQNSLTWNEFLNLGNSFKNRDNPFYVFTGGDFEGMMCCYNENISVENSKRIFNSKPLLLNDPASVNSLQLMVDLIHKYKLSPLQVTEFDEFSSYLYAANNNAVFLRGWQAFHKQYSEFLTDTTLVEKMKMAPLPHFEGSNTSATYGGWCLMVSKFSKHKPEAEKFIKFMFNVENQKILVKDGGLLPINKQVGMDSAFVKDYPDWKVKYDMLQWGKHRPFLKNYTRISEILSNSFHKALKKELTVEEALKEATERVNSEKKALRLGR